MQSIDDAIRGRKMAKEKENKKTNIFAKAKDKALEAANTIENIKVVDKDGNTLVDVSSLKEKAVQAGDTISAKAADVRSAALETKDDITEKLTELDRMLSQSVTDYNDAFTLMNDKGIQLYVERCKAVEAIENVEHLINSIANHPKSFDSAFEEIKTSRSHFIDSCEFAERELQAARTAAGGVGAGIAAGAAVAFMGPTAAMWVATTFGTASTGTAISTLSGAAATKAALAWLGGGALSAGGGGTAAGTALLAMAGPIGWTIAGATLLSSILLFTNKKVKLNKQKNEEIESLKSNTEIVKELDAKIGNILDDTSKILSGVKSSYKGCLNVFASDYKSLSSNQKRQLGALVNNTKALSALFEITIG